MEVLQGILFVSAHSASYCMVSFKSAWLKPITPLNLRLSNFTPRGFYSTEAYLEEARRMNILILPPCINSSSRQYKGRSGSIRVGLLQVHGLKEKTINSILKERSVDCFDSLKDFLLRTEISFSQAKILLRARAFDCFSKERLKLMWGLYFYFKKGKMNLLNSNVHIGNYQRSKLIRWEKETLGSAITFSEWKLYRHQIEQKNLTSSLNISKNVGKEITLYGRFVTQKVVRTKNKVPMCFCSFSDQYSIYETIFFPESYYLYSHLLFEQESYFVTGKVMSEKGAIQIQVILLELLNSNIQGLELSQQKLTSI